MTINPHTFWHDEEMYISQEELVKHKVPLMWRDYCAHLYVEMELCTKSEGYWPWKCELPRAAWMKCQYDELSLLFWWYFKEERVADLYAYMHTVIFVACISWPSKKSRKNMNWRKRWNKKFLPNNVFISAIYNKTK